MAEALRKAMKGFGTDEAALIGIIGKASPQEMAHIRQEYAQNFSRDLIKDIKDECSGSFEDALVALAADPAEYDAQLLRRAIKGMGTDEHILTEILCTRHHGEILAAAEAYKRLFGRELLSDIEDDTSGDLQKLYNITITGKRADDGNVEEDVQALFKAGEDRVGTNEGVFIRIIGGHSRAYVEKLYWAYADAHGKALDAVIESEFSGNTKKALVALVTPLDIYFSKKLHKAMAGAGTDMEALIRLVCTQRGRALKAISNRFVQDYKKTLKAWIADECSGDIKKILITVVDSA